MTDFIGTSRAPGIQAEVSNQLLSFEEELGYLGKGLGNLDYDDFIYGTTVVQLLSCLGDAYLPELWYRVFDLSTGLNMTVGWTRITSAMSLIKMVTADDGTIFYSDGTKIYKRTWTGSWSAESLVHESGQILDLAYESNFMDSTLYVYHYYVNDEPYFTWGVVDMYLTYGASLNWVAQWKGSIPSPALTNIRTGTVGQIVYLQNGYDNENSPYFFEFDRVHSGPAQKVVALDDLDDLQTFQMCGVTKILNGSKYETAITGVVSRKNGGKMLVYMIGQKEFTTGLNYYIDDVYRDDTFGNLHSYGGRVWLFGPDRIYFSNGSKYLSTGTRPVTQIEGPSTVQISMAPNSPFTLNMMAKTENFDNVEPGDELDITLSEGSSSVMSQFIVDGVRKVITDGDVTCQISAASKWMKMLADWNSDSYYDYWSQTKSDGNPSDLTKMVRYSGLWSEAEGALTIDDLNVDGILYLTDKASSNYSMRARFVRKSGDFNAHFGIVLNYQKETIADAALRLGKESTEVTEEETNKSGVFVAHGESFNGGAGGFRVYYYSSIADTKLTQSGPDIPFSVARDTYFQVMATFTNGYLSVYTYNESTKVWTYAGGRIVLIAVAGVQWNNDIGRAGIYMKNVTVTGECFPFISDSSVIPMVDNSAFPTSDIVIKDEEQITYTGKSQNVTVGNLPYRYGKRTAYFTTITGSNFDLGYSKTTAALRIRPVLSGTVWVKAIKLWVQKIGNPLDGIEVSICDPSSAYGILGSRKMTVNVPASDIPSAGGWITIKLGAGVEMGTSYNIQILKTRYAKTGFVSTTDYYRFKVTAGYTYASTAFNDTTDVWYGLSGSAAFELLTFPDASPTVASLAVAVSYGLTATNNFYNNQAIVVTSGSGEQAVAKIVGYSYFATDVCIFYTDIDINGGLDETSVLSVVPALTGLTRSNPSAHSGGKIDVYRAGPMALCENYAYFSEEKDMCLEDVVRKISRHAGVLNFSPKSLMDVTVQPNTNTLVFNKKSFIFDAYFDGDVTFSDNINFRFRMENSGGVYIKGLKFVMNSVQCEFYNSDGTLNAKIPGIGSRLSIHSHFRFSLFDRYLSIWDGDKLFHTFILNDEDIANTNDGFIVNGTSDIDLRIVIPDGYMRIDNFVLDMGKSGLSLIQQVIGNKRFYIQDSGDNLVFFRTRDTINTSGAPYSRIVSGTISKVEPPFTRICLEGGEVYETYDPYVLINYGNVFYRETINEINNLADAAEFATAILSDAGNSREPIAFQGALWPALQPEDILWAKLPDTTSKIIADSISYSITLSEKEASFDMTVQGRKI